MKLRKSGEQGPHAYFYAMYNYLNVKILLLVCLSMLNAETMDAQELIELNSGTQAHLRGLSVVNDRVIWASGTGGQVGRSTDGGQSWSWRTIPGFESVDFRDVEAFDELTAVVMGVGSPGYILRTTNGGKDWTIVYKNEDKRIFLDALYFWKDRSGMVIGDPIDGRFVVLRSFDGGRSWKSVPTDRRPPAQEGEACFAASGSNIAGIARDEAVFVSGGTQSRFFHRNNPVKLPMVQGLETTGANAIAAYRSNTKKIAKNLIIVGGDFMHDGSDSANCALSRDGGKSWFAPNRSPVGYRSGVSWIDSNRAIACGTSGVDISSDRGVNWQAISKTGFHTCTKANSGQSVFLAGAKGRIALLKW